MGNLKDELGFNDNDKLMFKGKILSKMDLKSCGISSKSEILIKRFDDEDDGKYNDDEHANSSSSEGDGEGLSDDNMSSSSSEEYDSDSSFDNNEIINPLSSSMTPLASFSEGKEEDNTKNKKVRELKGKSTAF